MNKVMLLLFVTSVALGATTLHLVRELRAERAHALTLETRVAQLERPAPPPPSPFASPSEGPAPEPVAPPTTTIVSTAPAPKPTPPVGDLAVATVAYGGGPMPSREDRMRMMRQRMEQQRALLRDPAYRDAMMTQQKAMMGNMYPDLANELNLAPGEFERLTTLLAEQQLRSMEQQSGPFFDGPPDSATAQEMQRKAQANRQAADAELKALLGDEKWNAWRDYQSTMGVRHEVAQLRTSLANQGAPLTDDQIKPLQRALADAQQGKVQAWNRTVSARSQLALAGGCRDGAVSGGAARVSGGKPAVAAGAQSAGARFRRIDTHGRADEGLRRAAECAAAVAGSAPAYRARSG